MEKCKFILLYFLFAFIFISCASESHRSVQIESLPVSHISYSGKKVGLSVGKFDNRSSYMRGLFSDGVDRLGSQAKTILISDLQSSQRFTVLDRENLSETAYEAKLKGKAQKLKAADLVITGDVTEFGRKEVGDIQLFGIIGRGKQQVAYAKVTLNVVKVKTSEIIYTIKGAGEYTLSNREIIGFGGTSSYDPTLNGKVLDLAIREAVNQLALDLDAGKWNSSIE